MNQKRKPVRLTNLELKAIAHCINLTTCGDMDDAGLQQGDAQDEKLYDAILSAGEKIDTLRIRRSKAS